MHSQRAKSLILPWSLFSLRMQAWPCFPRQQLLKGWTLLSLSSIDKLLHLLPYLHLLSSLKGCLWESHDIILLHLEPFPFYMLACWSFFRLTICSQNASPLSYSSVCKIFLVSLFGYVIIIRSLQFDFLSHFASFSHFTSVSCMDKFQAHSKLESLHCGNQLHYSHICCCHHQHNSCHHLCPGWFVKVKQN